MLEFNELVTFILIVWIAAAIPSIAYGVVLAQRSGKSIPMAILVCLLLPWIGIAFYSSQPPGTRKVVGLGYYCASMFLIAAAMAVISIFLPWVTGDPQLLQAESYAPKDVVLLAVLIGVWAISLVAASFGITRGGDMAAGVAVGVVVSVAGGVLVALVRLWGRAGLFMPDLREAQQEIQDKIQVGPGGWFALIALIVAYLCVTLLPFGLRLIKAPPPAPEMQPDPMSQMPGPGPGMPQDMQGGPWHPGSAPQMPQQPPQQQWPTQTGAGW